MLWFDSITAWLDVRYSSYIHKHNSTQLSNENEPNGSFTIAERERIKTKADCGTVKTVNSNDPASRRFELCFLAMAATAAAKNVRWPRFLKGNEIAGSANEWFTLANFLMMCHRWNFDVFSTSNKHWAQPSWAKFVHDVSWIRAHCFFNVQIHKFHANSMHRIPWNYWIVPF